VRKRARSSAARRYGRPAEGGAGRGHRGRFRCPAAIAAPAPGDEGPRTSPIAVQSRRNNHCRGRIARRRRRRRSNSAGRGEPTVTTRMIRPRSEVGQRRALTRGGGGGGGAALPAGTQPRESLQVGTAPTARHAAPTVSSTGRSPPRGSVGADRRHTTGRDHTPKDQGAPRRRRDRGRGGCRNRSGAERTN